MTTKGVSSCCKLDKMISVEFPLVLSPARTARLIQFQNLFLTLICQLFRKTNTFYLLNFVKSVIFFINTGK